MSQVSVKLKSQGFKYFPSFRDIDGVYQFESLGPNSKFNVNVKPMDNVFQNYASKDTDEKGHYK